MDPVEHVDFLSRSEHRVSILRVLRESGPTTQREFREQLSASRSTVSRSLSVLEDRGWITSNSDTYQLTAAGGEVTDHFLDLTDSVELTAELAPVLKRLPASELDFDLNRLSDATVTESTDSDPYAPVRRHIAGFEDGDSMRGLLPTTDLEAVRTLRDQLEDPEFSGSLVLAEDIADQFSKPEYEPVVSDLLAEEGCCLWVSESEIPFYLGIVGGETVQIGVEGDQGIPRALLETDDEAVREWAKEEFERYRARASPIDNLESL